MTGPNAGGTVMYAQRNFTPTTFFKKITNISLHPISNICAILGEKKESFKYTQVLLLYNLRNYTFMLTHFTQHQKNQKVCIYYDLQIVVLGI